MVLQRSVDTRVYGRADPAERIEVRLGAEVRKTVAGADGNWATQFDLQAFGPGPYELFVQGKNALKVSDVAIGEVWLCSGQSNMEFVLSMAIGAEQEAKASRNPMLRQFLVRKVASLTPSTDCQGAWVIADPSTCGQFTAVGYHFGKQLQRALGGPVGLINSTWGGTPAEAWTSEQGINLDPDLRRSKDRIVGQARSFPDLFAQYKTAYQAWVKQQGRTEPATPDPLFYASPSASPDGWRVVRLPGKLADYGLPDAGVIWLKRKVVVPASPAKGLRRGYQLSLGLPRDFYAVYWNGKKIVGTTYETPGWNDKMRFQVPLDILDLGQEATLAIRLFSPVGGAGIEAGKYPFNADGTPLAGEWLAKAEYTLPPLESTGASTRPAPPPPPPTTTAIASALFNGMINPLVNYSMKGVIWYQGESNADRANQYRIEFPLLIQDWRAHWQQHDLPFYYCQLANFLGKRTAPGDSAWAELREAQSISRSIPYTGMATLIDIGEEADIHPRNKQEVGARLARLALNRTYGQPTADEGPVHESFVVEGGAIRVRFADRGSALVARTLPATYQPSSLDPGRSLPLVRTSPGGEIEGFAICGADRQWHWAEAKIEGMTVVVSSPAVAKPVAVRYGWADNPTCNLYNEAGLPASPFRTDHFSGITVNAKY